MKETFSLLLIFLLACCTMQENQTNQEFFEFKNDDSQNFMVDLRLHVDNKVNKYTPMEKHTLKSSVYFKFTPIDEDGFCYYLYDRNVEDVYEKHSGRSKTFKGSIRRVYFLDKHGNQLFAYPFDDSYEVIRNLEYYEQGKSKVVTRSLLQKIDKLKIEFRESWKEIWHSGKK